MCGLGGQFFHDKVTPSEEALVTIGAAMHYRGPDDFGTYRSEHIGLVHRRLSIRDLSMAGHCPMPNGDGSIQVLFNGEIYNWRELRAELEDAGQSFQSQSDTEVIVHGYEVWSEKLFQKLQGMFAIAIWDAKESTLLLARDRIGEKPLYYCTTAAGLDFASSIEAIAGLRPTRQIDPVGIACHLVHSFIPASHTAWLGVSVLPPSHYLRIMPGGNIQVRRYWDFPAVQSSCSSYKSCSPAIEAVLEDSIVRCLDADVPVGIFLSGGVDSSLVAAIASRHYPGLPAFSVGFAEEDFNEIPYAKRVADHLGLAHHVKRVSLHDVLSCLPHLVMQYGQPFGDASAVPSYLLARHAREQVKVCLSGDGGDESFGGYWKVQSGVYAARYASMLPLVVRKYFVPMLAKGFGGVGQRWLALNKLSIQESGAGYTNSLSWLDMLGVLAGPRLQPVIGNDFHILRVGKSLGYPSASILQRILYSDFQTQLPDDYLVKVDVASMAASLEVRAPFLSQEVIEAAWALPDNMKLNWGRRKWLLKKIAAQCVPPDVIYRSKMGFGMPLRHWFRGELGIVLEKLFMDSIAVSEGWIRREPVCRMLDEQRRGGNHETRLWLALWLELWFRLVVSRTDQQDLQGLMLENFT